MLAVMRNSAEWHQVRDRVDLVAVAVDLLGDPEKEGSGTLYWRCPLHAETKPSFEIKDGGLWWRCRGCGEYGDVVRLVRETKRCSFQEALAHLSRDEFFLDEENVQRRSLARKEYTPTGVSEDRAWELVATAQYTLQLPEYSQHLAYLTGFRCLTPETIRAHRLGWTDGILVPRQDKTYFYTEGWVIPCFDDDGQIASIQVRRVDDGGGKYSSIYLDRRRFTCFPNLGTIRMGRPLIVVEGQFDALLLGQILEDLASVVTLGGTAEQVGPSFFSRAIAYSTRQYIALDNDESGDKAAAERWPASFRRVKPPGYKDWTDAYRNGVDLRQGWVDILSGREPEAWSFELLRYQPEVFVLDTLQGRIFSPGEVEQNNDYIDRFVRGEDVPTSVEAQAVPAPLEAPTPIVPAPTPAPVPIVPAPIVVPVPIPTPATVGPATVEPTPWWRLDMGRWCAPRRQKWSDLVDQWRAEKAFPEADIPYRAFARLERELDQKLSASIGRAIHLGRRNRRVKFADAFGGLSVLCGLYEHPRDIRLIIGRGELDAPTAIEALRRAFDADPDREPGTVAVVDLRVVHDDLTTTHIEPRVVHTDATGRRTLLSPPPEFATWAGAYDAGGRSPASFDATLLPTDASLGAWLTEEELVRWFGMVPSKRGDDPSADPSADTVTADSCPISDGIPADTAMADTAAGLPETGIPKRACNRCDLIRPYSIGFCPKCGCPEFRLTTTPAEVSAIKSSTRKPRKKPQGLVSTD
jgi:hypothetical protein